MPLLWSSQANLKAVYNSDQLKFGVGWCDGAVVSGTVYSQREGPGSIPRFCVESVSVGLTCYCI